jgi:hypothetical protein
MLSEGDVVFQGGAAHLLVDSVTLVSRASMENTVGICCKYSCCGHCGLRYLILPGRTSVLAVACAGCETSTCPEMPYICGQSLLASAANRSCTCAVLLCAAPLLCCADCAVHHPEHRQWPSAGTQ